MGLLSHRLPLGKIVGSLLLDVRLGIDSVLTGKFLGNGILDFDCLDCFRQVGKRLAPADCKFVALSEKTMQRWRAYHSVGGMTLTMPDFIPNLSILSMNLWKLRNWSIVCSTTSVHDSQLAHARASHGGCAGSLG